jgi:hypothetical protein
MVDGPELGPHYGFADQQESGGLSGQKFTVPARAVVGWPTDPLLRLEADLIGPVPKGLQQDQRNKLSVWRANQDRFRSAQIDLDWITHGPYLPRMDTVFPAAS